MKKALMAAVVVRDSRRDRAMNDVCARKVSYAPPAFWLHSGTGRICIVSVVVVSVFVW